MKALKFENYNIIRELGAGGGTLNYTENNQRKDMFMRKVKIFKYLYCLCVFNSLFWKYYFV